MKKKGRRIRRRGRQKKKELKSRVGGKRKEERDFVSSSSKKEHGALAHNNPLFYEMVVPLRMTHTVLSFREKGDSKYLSQDEPFSQSNLTLCGVL